MPEFFVNDFVAFTHCLRRRHLPRSLSVSRYHHKETYSVRPINFEMPVIPLSVVTRIIDHVPSHMPSLLTCSTICREWLSKVQYHLFTDINVRAHGDPRKLAEFAAFLETCTHIGPYVQSLSLDGRDKVQTLAASLSPEARYVRHTTITQSVQPGVVDTNTLYHVALTCKNAEEILAAGALIRERRPTDVSFVIHSVVVEQSREIPVIDQFAGLGLSRCSKLRWMHIVAAETARYTSREKMVWIHVELQDESLDGSRADVHVSGKGDQFDFWDTMNALEDDWKELDLILCRFKELLGFTFHIIAWAGMYGNRGFNKRVTEDIKMAVEGLHRTYSADRLARFLEKVMPKSAALGLLSVQEPDLPRLQA
ncbi:unnamed protein product [Somion occarium]|uniref:F-box domain-containing protein n=1 Tax=Somion occarium TaxID=3059160 RepID=A0ABP1DNA4_9APHY